jgi:hypothetical protein
VALAMLHGQMMQVPETGGLETHCRDTSSWRLADQVDAAASHEPMSRAHWANGTVGTHGIGIHFGVVGSVHLGERRGSYRPHEGVWLVTQAPNASPPVGFRRRAKVSPSCRDIGQLEADGAGSDGARLWAGAFL